MILFNFGSGVGFGLVIDLQIFSCCMVNGCTMVAVQAYKDLGSASEEL